MEEFTKKQEAQIEKFISILNCSREEAIDVLITDKAIDRGERTPYDLSPEEEKKAIKYTNTGTRKKPANYKFDKRERKANPIKGSLIAELAQFLTENSGNSCENVTITNKERQIAFKIGDNDYELTLIQKRKPKN